MLQKSRKTQGIVVSQLGSLALLMAVTFCSVHATEIEPFGRGPYAVGTTNMEVADAYSNLSSESMHAYLTRSRPDGRYITDILKHPETSWIFEATVPNLPRLYGPASGRRMKFSAFIAYPTTDDNDRPTYSFPHDQVSDGIFEHMQRPGDKPIFHDPHARYPLVVRTHGGGAHALYEVSGAKAFASHGYISIAINHGDSLDVAYERSVSAALRPFAIRALLDHLLSSEEFGSHIDHNRIGIVGHSWGGMTGLAIAGAKILNDPAAVIDPRIKAVAVSEPSLWLETDGAFHEIFGLNHTGLSQVQQPSIHVNGTQNQYSFEAMNHVSGSVYGIFLPGQPHNFEGPSWVDMENWQLLFFGAYLKNDDAMLAQLRIANSVKGYNQDFQNFSYQKVRPNPPVAFADAFSHESDIDIATHRIEGRTASRVTFPSNASYGSPLYYDLQFSNDGRNWTTLAAEQIETDAEWIQGSQLTEGFEWMTLVDPANPETGDETRLYRVRASR